MKASRRPEAALFLGPVASGDLRSAKLLALKLNTTNYSSRCPFLMLSAGLLRYANCSISPSRTSIIPSSAPLYFRYPNLITTRATTTAGAAQGSVIDVPPPREEQANLGPAQPRPYIAKSLLSNQSRLTAQDGQTSSSHVGFHEEEGHSKGASSSIEASLVQEIQ